MSLQDLISQQNLSLGQKVQDTAIELVNMKDHPVLGQIGGRVVAILVKPPARIMDVVIHIILAIGKLLVGVTVTIPLQIGGRLIGKEYESDWNIRQGSLHLGYGVLYTLDIFASPILNLIDPNIYKLKFAITQPEANQDLPPTDTKPTPSSGLKPFLSSVPSKNKPQLLDQITPHRDVPGSVKPDAVTPGDTPGEKPLIDIAQINELNKELQILLKNEKERGELDRQNFEAQLKLQQETFDTTISRMTEREPWVEVYYQTQITNPLVHSTELLIEKRRGIGKFARWMIQQAAAGQLRMPENIVQVFKLPNQTRKLDLSLTDSVLGANCLNVYSSTLTGSDQQFLLECYQQFIVDQLKHNSSNSQVIELSLADIRELQKLLRRPDQPEHGNLLEQQVTLQQDQFEKAVAEINASRETEMIDAPKRIAPDVDRPPQPPLTHPESLSASLTHDGFILMDVPAPLETSIEDNFSQVTFRETNHTSLINYEIICGISDATTGISKVRTDGVDWIQYTLANKPMTTRIRYRVSEPVLKVYEQLLGMNDHSYAAANMFTKHDPQQIETILQRHDQLNQELEAKKWKDTIYVAGSTGRGNIDPDYPCIIRHNPVDKMIVVTFHGSRNGSKIPIWHNGRGDWGANFDNEGVPPKDIGLDIDLDIRVHKGFGRNVESVQTTIQNYLTKHLTKLPPKIQKQYRVIFTGHSKGAAEANIATLMAKEYLEKQHIPAEVGALVFSSPRAFFGDDAPQKVDEKLGFPNMIRINVYGDPVANVPPLHQGARSVGILVLDSIYTVSSRLLRVAPQLNRVSNYMQWYVQSCAGYHYGSSMRGAGMEFDPRIVIKKEELTDGIMAGLEHMIKKGEDLVTRFMRKRSD